MVSLKEPKDVKECLELQSHFIGIPKISKKNLKFKHDSAIIKFQKLRNPKI